MSPKPTYEELEKRVADLEREAVEQVKESKRMQEVYLSLLNSSADAVVIYDLHGRTVHLSPAFTELFGWTLQELKGELIPFVPESEKEATSDIIRDLLESGRPCRNFETRRYTKDRRLLDVSMA
ncbi:MAG: PAS domain S-box protein, partial [Desulfobacteraceae bacterium]